MIRSRRSQKIATASGVSLFSPFPPQEETHGHDHSPCPSITEHTTSNKASRRAIPEYKTGHLLLSLYMTFVVLNAFLY
jgi:hypothetical protein